MTNDTTILAATWADHEQAIRSVRHKVFVVEQAVPAELDFDGLDPICRHALAFCGDTAIATGRMESDGHIGRVAVLKAHRGCGIGSAILQFFMGMARQRELEQVYLNAQVSAVGFYEKLGFRRTGDLFMDADIEHVRMERASV